METVLSDHPSVPRQACLLCSDGAAGALQMLISPALQEACPSLVVGCFLDLMQSWCSVTDFMWLYWGSYLVFGVVGSANSKRELCLPTCTTHCLNFVGNMQQLFSAGSRKDVTRFANAASLE